MRNDRGRFRKGFSGNPAGRPKKAEQALARGGHRYERKPEFVLARDRPDIEVVGKALDTPESWAAARLYLIGCVWNPPQGAKISPEAACLFVEYKNAGSRMPSMEKKQKVAPKAESTGGNEAELLKLLRRGK
jgi:hypothetical protein